MGDVENPGNPAVNTELFRHNLGRDLHFVSRELARALMQKNAARGYHGLKLNWDMVFVNMNLVHGSRLVDLAEMNGLTKQAMSQIVNDIEEHGYVSKKADPVDGRAKNVMLTRKGWQLVQDAITAQDEIEKEYASLIGTAKLQQLRDILGELAAAIHHQQAEKESHHD